MSDKDPILMNENFDFQDFSNTIISIPDDTPTIPATKFDDYNELDTPMTLDSDNLLGEENPTPPSTAAFWSFQFYQQYFNVNDQMVLERLMYACIPNPNSNYLERLKPLPDFYGPLWVCITLIFSTAISGNIADFFQSLGEDTAWSYDFKKVTIAATVILTYVTVVPALLSGYLWWRKSSAKVKLAETLSLYGYCLTVFIPISLLLCINQEWVRWILVVALIGTSGAVLTLTLWRVLSEEPKQMALIITGVAGALHLALILLFKMYFFASASKSTPESPS